MCTHFQHFINLPNISFNPCGLKFSLSFIILHNSYGAMYYWGNCFFLFLLSSAITVLNGKKPNVLIFLVDDLGYGDLGYTGHPTTSSPNIDSLARSGRMFTQFYSGSSVCTPSRATLQTGFKFLRCLKTPRCLNLFS